MTTKIYQHESVLSIREDLLDDDFSIRFDILPAYDNDLNEENARQQEILKSISDIDIQLANLDEKIKILNVDIDKLTNHADGIDYAAAVLSGIITGLIDSLFVGEWDFKKAKAKSNMEMNKKVMDFAKKNGYEGDSLSGAVAKLEEKFKLPGDHEWSGAGINVSAKSHHLDDFCHHPTIVGLICNVAVQFTGSTRYVNRFGTTSQSIPVTVNEYGNFVGKNPVTKLFSGIINWFFQVGKTMANTNGHWMSDMAGSKATAGNGMGLPGSFMSIMKELSALPLFQDSNFGVNLHKAYTKGIGTDNSQIDLGAFNSLFEGASSKVDMRTENALKSELLRQALPIIINEILVRGFYFIRRFIKEVKEVDQLKDIKWKKVLPFNNRTIVRMMTIASGTFTAIDLADAAIRSAVEAGPPTTPAYWSKFVLKVNFVGIGRFFVAVGADVGMGTKRQKLIKNRMKLKSKELMFQNTKLFLLQEDMWIEAMDTEKAINDMCITAEKTMLYFVESWDQIMLSLDSIGNNIDSAEENNEGLMKDLEDILIWG